MNVSEPFILRPVGTTLLMAAILLSGIVAYTFLKDQARYTLPVWLASFSTASGGQVGTDYGGQMAGAVLFSLPVVVFFLIIQRNLVSGMSAGAVKG